MNRIKYISILLGATLLGFGMLKFVQPFRGWVQVQIRQSGLPSFAFRAVIAGEMAVGFLFLSAFLILRKRPKMMRASLVAASVATIGMMAVAVYVHLNPNVPADVLPLKIKPPYIPLVYIIAATVNLLLIIRSRELRGSKEKR